MKDKTLTLRADSKDPPIGALIVAEIVKEGLHITIEWNDKETALSVQDNFVFNSDVSICRYLAKFYKEFKLFGESPVSEVEIDHWLTFSIGPLKCINKSAEAIIYLNKVLATSTYFVDNTLTVADICVWAALYASPLWNKLVKESKAPEHVLRWYNFIKSLECTDAVVTEIIPSKSSTTTMSKPNQKVSAPSGERKQEGKFLKLPHAVKGHVIVRFPPEASGFLHIGHAKAALLNQYYQLEFEGKLIMRFDDTNPAKEKVDFEKVILEDVELLSIKPDLFTRTSDHFEKLLVFCEQLLKEGKAYVDDTDPEVMKNEREKRIESTNRSNDVEKNMKMWAEMKDGTEYGQKCCVRAKIDMQSANGCMRDPTMYRCKNEPHPCTGNKYRVYPTYDFACPIVDSIEGVTHSLRTTEYQDRDEQFYWFINALNLRRPHIEAYSRLNMTHTVLSKRKLTWFVDNKIVDGWDDPRMPTVRGVLRHGMTVEGLKQFILAQGSSRSVVFMEWDKIWAFNKKVIDPVAPRYTAVDAESFVPVHIKNVEESSVSVPKHPKNSEVGTREILKSSKVFIDLEDANALEEGKNATFIHWGNLKITKITKENGVITSLNAEPNLEDKDFKNTFKVTWLADSTNNTPCTLVYLDHLMTKGVLGKDEDFKDFINYNSKSVKSSFGDPDLKSLKKSDIIQIQRKGFFICDEPYRPASSESKESPVVLIFIPDGHSKPAASGSKPASVEGKAKSSSNTNTKVKSSSDNVKSLDPASAELLKSITDQGNKIRQLKNDKADKTVVGKEVEILLKLKAEFKNLTGTEWSPKLAELSSNNFQETKSSSVADVAELLNKITEQGNKIRQLKSEKADKSTISKEVELLLKLKADYKTKTGTEWSPKLAETNVSISGANEAVSANTKSNESSDVTIILNSISEQGNKIRQLKSSKADKSLISKEVETLLKLKSDYKTLTGEEWTPKLAGTTATIASNPPQNEKLADKSETSPDITELSNQISDQGNKIRQLKSDKVDKSIVGKEVEILLKLKMDYKTKTGVEWRPTTTGNETPAVNSNQKTENKEKKEKKEKKDKKEKAPKEKQGDSETSVKKQTRLGLEAKKEENLAEWYSQIITKGELIEYYDVSGCYILRPNAYAIWEQIQAWFDKEIKKLGVKNCYFPIFVSQAVLEKEKTHISDFAPEVAWVTKSGNSEMAEPIAIRPTSETVMYPAFAKWIQSHRDLPIKLNQWNNVVRWEFKHPQPFIRTREFLWQEGHTAFALKEEAEKEVLQILDLYEKVYTDLLAIPVVRGRKTEKEKFAGGDYTTTVEAFVSASGRAVQGATSHHLGQNFSKMFEIIYEDPETKEKNFVYQNSWGLTTRTIGVMIMVHSDNQGLVIPPKVAFIQVIIVPCGITASMKDSERKELYESCAQLASELTENAVKVETDFRDNYSPGWKFNSWELKGVPVRVELGPKDMKNDQFVAVRRDSNEKITFSRKNAVEEVKKLLDNIQASMLKKATEDLNSHLKICTDWSNFCSYLDDKNIILAPFCGEISCEDKIKDSSARNEAEEAGAPSMGAKSLCIPFDQPNGGVKSGDKCINPSCSKVPKFYTLFGRSY